MTAVGTEEVGAYPEADRGQRPRFTALDGVRAVAAFGVVATHAGFNSGRSLDNGPFAPLLSRLDFGVTLFFLLSGFVIYRPFVTAALAGRPRPSGTRFLVRRFVRILPAYWLAIAVTFAALSLRHSSSADWWHYALLVQTYDSHNVDPSLTQMWTLSVELSFYLLVPLGARWACGAASQARIVHRNVALIAILCVVTVGAGITAHLVPAVGTRSLLWLPANVDWFALGMLLAVVSACGAVPDGVSAGLRRWQPRSFGVARTVAAATGTCWTLGVLIFWFATLPLAGPRLLLVPNTWEWLLKHLLYGASALFLLAPLTLSSPGRWALPLEWRPMRLLGEISYGIYLWHLPLLLAIQHWLGYRTFSGHFWTLLGVTSLASVAVAWLSWHLLEQPLIRFANRRYSESRADSSPSGTAGMRNAASASS